MKKKIAILVLLIGFQLQASNFFKEVTLLEFVSYVSLQTGKNIFFTDKIKNIENISLFVPVKLKSNNSLFDLLDLYLREKGYYLKRFNDVYYVDVLKKQKYYSYTFKYIGFNDVEKLLSVFKNVKFSFLKDNNMLVFSSSSFDSIKIINFLKKVDLPKKQAKIRLSVLLTDLNKLKSFGTENPSINLDFVGSLSSSLSSSGSSFLYNFFNQTSFNSSLRFLTSNGYTKILQSPELSLRDGLLSKLSFVNNTPVAKSSTTIKDGVTSIQVDYEYKDIGLIIEVLPKITNDYLYINLKFTIETVISNIDNLPITQKIYYEQSFKLNKYDVLHLSGLTKTENFTSLDKVPILGDIPLLSYVFSYDKTEKKDFLVSISIQRLLDSNATK